MFEGKGYVELNEESIFREISEYDVFSYYIPCFKALNKKFKSPLREDKTPSCGIKDSGGKLFYKDFSNGEVYTAISFVMKRFNASYFEALRIISNDFNLGLSDNNVTAKSMGIVGTAGLIKKSVPIETIIKIKRREWNANYDKTYWSSYGWNKKMLNHFNIHPISHLWINNTYLTIKSSEPSYAYVIGSKFKILSPRSPKFKWLSNTTSSDIQGWKQLPKKGSKVIISSSMKDSGLLDRYGYPSCSPSSENTAIPKECMDELKERFNEVIVLFDADEAGIEAAKVYVDLYDIKSASMPLGGCKDPSDHYKMYGYESTKQLLNKIL